MKPYNHGGRRLHDRQRTAGIAAAHMMFGKTWADAQSWVANNPAGDLQALTEAVIRLGETLGRHPELFSGQSGTTDRIMVERIMGLILCKARRLTITLSTRQAADICGLGRKKTGADSLHRLVEKRILTLVTPGHKQRTAEYHLNVEPNKVSTIAPYRPANTPENVWAEVGQLRAEEPVHDLFVSAAKDRDSIGLTALAVYEVIAHNDLWTFLRCAALSASAATPPSARLPACSGSS